MTQTDRTLALLITASTVLQYVFAGIVGLGYFFSPTWMWIGIYGVAASVVLHLIVRYLYNRNLPDAKR